MAAFLKKTGRCFRISMCIAVAMSCTISANAQTSYASTYEVVEYKKSLVDLLLQCPKPQQSKNHDADIASCKKLEPKLIELRTNHRVKKWRWADDRLNHYQAILHGNIMGHYFIKAGRRDVLACHHAEKSWLNLHKISVDGRKNDDFFFKFRSPAHKMISLCRKEIGTPEWGVPLALGSPLPR